MIRFALAVSLALATALALVAEASAITIFSASGNDASDIQATVDTFRAALGNPNNGNGPPSATGHREINWDGGGDATSPGGTPFNVFLNNRGGQFSTPGTGFFQAPPTGGSGGGLATVFSNPTYGTIFDTFSAQRLFVPVASNVTDAIFFIPGTGGTVRAGVQGFGAVFTDVDIAGSTRIELYDFEDNLIDSVNVPNIAGDNTLSFLGLLAGPDDPQFVRVRLITGTDALGPNDGGVVDVVAMDDFIYSEPQLVGAPAALVLLAAALPLAALARRRPR
jgi:hypothetical protein